MLNIVTKILLYALGNAGSAARWSASSTSRTASTWTCPSIRIAHLPRRVPARRCLRVHADSRRTPPRQRNPWSTENSIHVPSSRTDSSSTPGEDCAACKRWTAGIPSGSPCGLPHPRYRSRNWCDCLRKLVPQDGRRVASEVDEGRIPWLIIC